MDGTSPGNVAINFGTGMRWLNPQTNEWQAETPPPSTTCVANPPPAFAGFMNIGSGVGDLGGYLPCGCYGGPWWGVVPPPQCAMHGGGMTCVPVAPVNPLLDQRKPLSSDPADWYREISDADVDRIARRVVELLAAREAKP
jgi:hypothetical protein